MGGQNPKLKPELALFRIWSQSHASGKKEKGRCRLHRSGPENQKTRIWVLGLSTACQVSVFTTFPVERDRTSMSE